MNKELLKNTFLEYKYFFLFSPIFLNYLLNIFFTNNKLFNEFNLHNFLSIILFLFFFFNVGSNIKESLKLNSISFGIAIFILSFFILENLNIAFYQNFEFNVLIYINLLFWMLLFVYKKNRISRIFIAVSSLGILQVFNNSFINKFDINTNIEVDAWYYIEFSKLISERGYLYSLENNIFTGYSQFSSYLHSIFHFLNFNSSDFMYFRSTTNVLFFLSILLLIEASNNFKNQILSIFLYICLTLNSNWLSFLMIDSLMSEGIMNYLFAVIVFSIFNEKNTKLVFLFLGFLIFSKQFYITLIMISIPIFVLNKYYRKHTIYLIVGYILKQILYLTRLNNLEQDHHIRQIDLKDTFFDLLLLRDLKIENALLILKNLALDIPFTLFLTIVLCLFIYKFKHQNSFELIYYFFLVVTNIVLILLLYISVWRFMELESPIRFILNLYLLLFVFLERTLDINKKESL